MARFGHKIDRFVLRIAGCLALLGMTAGASAQISEQDRLQRCENNRARMLEIQAQWPTGAAGWSEDSILGGRLLLAQLLELEQRSFNYNRRAGQSSGRLSPRGDLRAEYERNEAEFDRLRPTMQRFGLQCTRALWCVHRAIEELQSKLAEAGAARPQRDALLTRFNGFRDNYIALNCVEGIAVSDSQDDLGFAMMTGTFDSSFGTLTLSTGGGAYDYYGGQVRVTGISGNVMEGTWTQTRAGRQCPDGQYRGRFRFAFSASGFTGSFGYCEDEPGAGVWNGTRR
jgi:hypothetical protein